MSTPPPHKSAPRYNLQTRFAQSKILNGDHATSPVPPVFDSSFSILVVGALVLATAGGAWSQLLQPASKTGPRVLYALAAVLLVAKIFWNILFRIVFDNTQGAHAVPVFDAAAGHWRLQNWGRIHVFHPKELLEPTSLDELINAVQQAGRKGRKVKPLGALHSWSSCMATNDVAIKMHKLNKVLSYDQEKRTITAESGIMLRDLYNRMTELDLALPSVPNVDVITLGGAVSNATHGTNFTHGTFSSYVTELSIVLFRGPDGSSSNAANGKAELVTLKRSEAKDRHWFEAAIASFGSLGAIYSLTLQCIEPYVSSVFETCLLFEEVKGNIDVLARTYPCCQMSAMSNGTTMIKVQVPVSNRVVDANTTNLFSDRDLLQAKLLFFAIQPNAKTWLWLRRPLSFILAKVLAASPLVNAWTGRRRYAVMHWKDAEMMTRMAAAMSTTPWTNLEYAIPIERANDAHQALSALLNGKGVAMFAMRPVAADELGYLSPTVGRSTVFFDVPYNATLESSGIYDEVEKLLLSLGGRCSWARYFKAKYSEVVKQYPKFPQFVKAKQEMDPFNVFSNPFSDGIISSANASQAVSYRRD